MFISYGHSSFWITFTISNQENPISVLCSVPNTVTYRDNTYMSPDPSTGFRFLPLFFPRTPQPSCTFPPLFYQLPLSFYQLPLLFRSFSHASATYCIASASEHVSRGSVHFRLHY